MKYEYFWQYNDLEDLAGFRDDLRAYIRDFYLVNITNLDTVVGFNLDLLGKILGIDRRPAVVNIGGFVWNQSNWNSLNDLWNDSQVPNEEIKPISDGLYRKVLKVRAMQQAEKRTIENLIGYLDQVFDNLVWTYTNNINDVIINYDGSTVTQEEKAVLDSGFILPPQGCTITFIEV